MIFDDFRFYLIVTQSLFGLNGLLRVSPRVKFCPAAGGMGEPRPPSLSWQFFGKFEVYSALSDRL